MATSSDTASLVIKVDASQTDAGAKSLDNLSASADNADKSVQQLNETTDQQSSRLKAMVAASMEKVRAQQAEIQASIGSNKATDAQRAALDALNKSSNTQADMNARGAAILAAEERSRKAATVGIADQTAGLTQLLGKIDPSVAALERLDAMQAKLAAFRTSGAISGEDFAVYSAKIAQARGEIGKAAEATSHLTLNSSMARREIGRMGTDLAQGNYGRLSNTTLTLANYTGIMGLAFSATGAAILGVAGVAALLVAAYAKGSAETDAYNKSLILTGNYAGLTTQQLQAMAVNMSGVTGTQHAAAAALAEVAATGKFTASQIQLVGTAAVAMSDLTGQATAKTIQQFESLAEKPVEAVLKLNESQHFLTTATYEQIKALEDQGHAEEAATLAMQTYSKALDDRRAEVVNNAGLMVQAWRGLASAAKGAWDAMLDVGRPKPEQAQFDALAKTRDRLLAAQQAGTTVDVTADGKSRPIQEAIDEYTRKMMAMQDARIETEKAASKKAADAAMVQLDADTDAQIDKFSSNADKLTKAKIKIQNKADKDFQAAMDANNLGLAVKVRKAEELAVAAAEKQYAEKPARASRAGGSKSDPFASLNGLVQNAQVKADNFGTENNQTQQVTSILAIVDAGAKLIASGKDVATVQAKVAVGVAAVNELYAKQADQLKQKNVAAMDKYNASLLTANEALQRSVDSQVAKISMGDKEYQQQQQVNDLYRKGAEALRKLNAERAAPGANTALIDQQIAATQANTDTQVAIVRHGFDEIDAAQTDWRNGAVKAYQDYLDSATNVAGQSATVFSNAFNSMGDSLASFATTGKLNFKGLVTSILGDLAKMEMRIAMSKILQSVLGAFMNNPSVYNSATPQQQVAFDVANGSANGNVFSSPGLSAYSNTIVDKPTFFAKGGNVMGEAGPEAIMPLQRGSDGKLGVKAIGADGGGITINTNVTVDSNGNAQSQTDGDNSEAARQLGKMIETKVREVMTSESRQGGQLWRMSHA